ncbi:hypothetical protein EDC18_101502 [Natranaerovirga pectinivora]|uniref:Uncharacterized protein n=1 Tax=Natranaerovirga pectinivora TaxID=682400 RepID=A0A4R3MQZ7_9FIRM|nr:hypothetical protein [Natranaerovirga pectinivora]TCT17204.1 hypothetical protein EDC18_101502 [Natranaerovirga pectinivora]
MRTDNYKEKFIKNHLYYLEELNKDEMQLIPKSNKKEQSNYLMKMDWVLIDDKFYKKVYEETSDQEISIYTQMKMVDLLSSLGSQVSDLRKEQKMLAMRIKGMQVSLTIIVIILLVVVLL